MKRIFYRVNEDLYLDVEGFTQMIEQLDLNVGDLEGASLLRDGENHLNTYQHLVHVN